MSAVGAVLGLDTLYVKRDDLTSDVYGGNKVRKLEFLLADAVHRRAREVVTFGYAGSNHALATAIHARRLGIGCSSMLLPQVNAHYVRQNLLASLHAGSILIPCRDRTTLSWVVLVRAVRGCLRSGGPPVFIPAGGTCPLGITGYVNAAFELRDQIRGGTVPEPDFIYVALGSMGTTAGLILGLRAAGVRSRVVAVRVIEERMAPANRLLSLVRQTQRFLRRLDNAFPESRFMDDNLTIRTDCLGDGYARFTQASVAAANLLHELEGIETNGTYTAKAFAAIVRDAERGLLRDRVVLFWNTYNSRPLPGSDAATDYRLLPTALHRYFETDVQPPDRGAVRSHREDARDLP